MLYDTIIVWVYSRGSTNTHMMDGKKVPGEFWKWFFVCYNYIYLEELLTASLKMSEELQ
jgi:hypothetical protein